MRPTLWSEGRAAAYRRAGHWTAETFVDALARRAAEAPGALALADGRRELSWSDAHRWVERVACALARALPPEAVLATWLPNSIEHYLLRSACEGAGLVWLPIPYAARAAELRAILGASGAAGLVFAGTARRDAWGELAPLLPSLPALAWRASTGDPRAPGAPALEDLSAEPTREAITALEVRRIRPGELAMLVPTSGSTGVPKLCEYVLDGAVARGSAQLALFRLGPSDVIVATVQGFGPSITPLLAAPLAAAAVVVMERAEPEALLAAIDRHRATVVCGVPTVYRDLLPLLDGRARSVRIWYSTGAAMPADLAAEIEGRSAGVVVSGYGGVDLGCWTCPAPEDPPAVRHHSVGRPCGGTELRIDPEGADGSGEVLGRGPSSTWGYYRDALATREAWTKDGWFRTGDIGRLDADGNLVLVGRKVEVIDRGGHKVHPEEVERALETHAAVARAAVVPYPDERLGQRVCAYVVPRDGAAPTLADLVAYLRDRGLASYKLPERLEVVTKLPTSPGGKVARRALAAAAAEVVSSGRRMA